MRNLLVLLLLAGAACSAKRTPPELAWDKAASFTNIKTFGWYDDPSFEYPRGFSIVDGHFIDEHVRKDVETALAGKGYRKEETGSPDIWVAYHTSPEGLVEHDAWGQYTWWAPYRHIASTSQKRGALALDIRGADKKLVWRGVVTGVVGSNAAEVAESIHGAVTDLLGRFPPQ